MKRILIILPILFIGCMSEPEQIEPDLDVPTPHCVRILIDDEALGNLCFQYHSDCEVVRDGLIEYGVRAGVTQVGECS